MSVLIQLTMFPTDKGESVSKEVSRVIDMIDGRGIDYRLTPMSTIMECETMGEALAVIADAYALLEPDCNRIYASATFDIRKGKSGRMAGKIASVEKKIGKKPRT